MGNLCSRSTSSSNTPDPFAQPGRVLGSAPPKPSNPTAAVPGGTRINSVGIGGGGSGSGGGGHTLGGAGTVDARGAAAKAAEERAAKAKSQPSGKLGKDLAAQKAQRRTDTLGSLSQDERRRRDADTNTDLRNYN